LNARPKARSAGVAVPLFSLRSKPDSGIGEIFDLVPFADWAAFAGQRIVALLPLGEVGPGESSPYNALSSFAIDPLHVTLSEIPELAGTRGLEATLASADRIRQASLDRDRVRAWKLPFLEEAHARFRKLPDGDARVRELGAFRREQSLWLEDYVLFRALYEERGGESWKRWPGPLRDRDARALAKGRRRLRERVALFEYLQFVAEEQWWRVREHVRKTGVALMGDLPFAPAENSADVWGNQELFDPSRSVGAPPDDFSETGQRWGLPMYRWQAHRGEGWRWFRSRVRRMADLYDLYRIDHVVGLFRTYSFAAGDHGAFEPADVTAQQAQGLEILEMMREESGASAAVAEDLGSIPDFVRHRLAALDIPGYKVFRWERNGGDFIDPREYPECSIATTGTHDTESLAVWWSSLSRADRTQALRLLGHRAAATRELRPEIRRTLLGRLYESGSRYVILPIQDLFGWSERINRPATIGPENWSYRLPVAVAELSTRSALAEETRRLAALIDAGDRFGTMTE
jgi:4-alpha-glucanotransferase